MKNIYEDFWKEFNQINTSIKLPLIIRLDNKKASDLVKFEKILNKLDLVNDFSIKKFNKDHIFMKLFLMALNNFINIMKNKDYTFDTRKKYGYLNEGFKSINYKI